MTSGIPFSDQEIDYVRQHSPHEFPSIIARGLALKYREYNGGYRNPKAVALLMKRLNGESVEKPAGKKKKAVPAPT